MQRERIEMLKDHWIGWYCAAYAIGIYVTLGYLAGYSRFTWRLWDKSACIPGLLIHKFKSAENSHSMFAIFTQFFIACIEIYYKLGIKLLVMIYVSLSSVIHPFTNHDWLLLQQRLLTGRGAHELESFCFFLL